MIKNVIFFIITIYILLRTIAFGLYELKEKNNKTGGICVIAFSSFSVLLSNIIIWIT